MKYWVYIIYSKSLEKYYKGYSLNVMNRVDQHNNNESRYTANKGPWELVFAQTFETKSEALKREKVLKNCSKAQIIELCMSRLNEI